MVKGSEVEPMYLYVSFKYVGMYDVPWPRTTNPTRRFCDQLHHKTTAAAWKFA
jgi:hypothetical protein